VIHRLLVLKNGFIITRNKINWFLCLCFDGVTGPLHAMDKATYHKRAFRVLLKPTACTIDERALVSKLQRRFCSSFINFDIRQSRTGVRCHCLMVQLLARLRAFPIGPLIKAVRSEMRENDRLNPLKTEFLLNNI
jgi:hypothetical protein